MLCFAGQNVSRKRDGEACPADGCETVPAMLGSWSDRPRIEAASSGFHFHTLNWGSLARKLRLHIICYFHFLRENLHDSFVLTSSFLTLWGTARTTASFSHLPLSLFEGSLARKLRLHIFIYTSSTLTFWGKSRAKPSFSYLPLSLLEGSLAWTAFLRDSRCTKCCVLQDRTCLGRRTGKLVRRTGARRCRLCSDHGRMGPALELRVRASFSQFELSKFEGSLARKLRFVSSTFRCRGKSRTKASFSFSLFGFQILIWRKSRTKASLSHLQLSDFEGSLARQLRSHIFHFHFLREVSRDSFVLTSSAFTFWGKSRMKGVFER